jgi:hypothetical protein
VAFYLGAVGALSRRGGRCLAAERGESEQQERDKEKSWVCARESRGVGRILWREDRSRGSQSARREDAKCAHTRCSMNCGLSGHGR